MGVLCFVLVFQNAVLSINSSFAITRERELVAVYLQSCDCKRSVSLPHGVVGWSAVCDCGIFRTLRLKKCAQHSRMPDVIPHIL